ncbi:MAG: glycosyltransferase family 4 protein [Deltaproteobacteria bacterium]|nr:glycosyltransferase family 4 protein [Deltaproteobacteria bacterium]
MNSDVLGKILTVSKPVAPPWNDSSKNLVRDLAMHGDRFSYRVLTTADYQLVGRQVSCEQIYQQRGSHTPTLRQNLKVLARLLRGDDTSITHFFFAPNPKSSWAGALASKLRARRTVQTVCSIPASFASTRRLLFADRVIVLSEHTARCFADAGFPAERLHVIPPGIALPARPDAETRAATRRRHNVALDADLVVFPGDYQFSRAAQTVAEAAIKLRRPKTVFVFACRVKQQASRLEEDRIRRMLSQAGIMGSVRLYNQLDDILDVLGAADACILPAESLFAKMDLPMVLIEALAMGVPIIVGDQPPLVEIMRGEIGMAIPAVDPTALADALSKLLNNKSLHGQLSDNARRVARDHFDVRNMVRRYEDLYAEMLR